MAVEGSLVLPLFLFFMMTLLMSLEIVRFQSNMQEALHQTGNNLAFREYRGKAPAKQEEDTEGQIREYLDDQLFPYLCIADGAEGVRLKTEKETNGRFQIYAEYEIKPFTALLPIGEITIKDSFWSHQWIGYRGDGFWGKTGKEEIYVYITETGSKYHLDADCTHLRIPISMVSSDELKTNRNQSGEAYAPCQRCRPQSSRTVYLTSEGTSFHARSDCPSLRRTVHRIPLSEAGKYGCCSKCAKG